MRTGKSGGLVFDVPAPYYPSDALSLDELAYWVAFSRFPGIGPKRFHKLLTFFDNDVIAAWKAESNQLTKASIDQKTIEKFVTYRKTVTPQQELERLEKRRIRVVTLKDETYPPLLKKFEYAPIVLYIYGRLAENDSRFTVGVVGTRKMSGYGRQVTERFTTDLAKASLTIVSGLALGVDTVAHHAALDAGGRTLAVLANGLDTIYPAENLSLAKHIVESGQGALISAYPLGVRPDAGNFPARNHIIAGLSLGILVTEAPSKSGALITASSALEQGREVFAVPGGIFSPSSSGVNKLIQDGAHPVMSAKDIVEQLDLRMVPEQVEAQEILPHNDEERALLKHLSYEAQHIDELTRASEMESHIVSATLTMMELKGMVRQVGPMLYVISR